MTFPFEPNKQSNSRDSHNIRKKLPRSETSETANPQGNDINLLITKDKNQRFYSLNPIINNIRNNKNGI